MTPAELLAHQDEIRLASRARLRLSGSAQHELNALMKPAPAVFLRWLAIHLGVWLAAALLVLASDSLLLHALAVLVMGSQLHAFTVLQHDCGHQSAFASTRLNNAVGRALAVFIVFPYSAFTECHKNHHRYLGDVHKDPDDWHYAGGVKWLFLRIALFVPRFIWFALTRYGSAVRNRVLLELAGNLLLMAALAAVFASQGLIYAFVLIFVLPLLLLAVVFNPLSRGYEHFPMATLAEDDPARLDLAHNCVTVSSRLLSLAWANINYHVEHHAYPAVPFHNLPRLAELLANKPYQRDRWLLERLFRRRDSAPAQQLAGE